MCSVHDAVEFEKRGIPATVVLTQIFKNAAIHQFKSRGMEGHPMIELPHPIANLSYEQMHALTLTYIDQLARQLTN